MLKAFSRMKIAKKLPGLGRGEAEMFLYSIYRIKKPANLAGFKARTSISETPSTLLSYPSKIL